MNISVDTNVLIRAVLQDDPVQGKAAANLMSEASLIAISLPSLCEFVWVLLRGAKLSRPEVAQSIRGLLEAQNVSMNRTAVEAGGDFADGVLAHEGHWLGGKEFLTFDAEAAQLLTRLGLRARVPS